MQKTRACRWGRSTLPYQRNYLLQWLRPHQMRWLLGFPDPHLTDQLCSSPSGFSAFLRELFQMLKTGKVIGPTIWKPCSLPKWNFRCLLTALKAQPSTPSTASTITRPLRSSRTASPSSLSSHEWLLSRRGTRSRSASSSLSGSQIWRAPQPKRTNFKSSN